MRLTTLAFLLPLISTLAAQTDQSQTALTRFDDQDKASVAERWYSVNDGVMGGRSRGTFDIDDQRLVFSGTLNTNGGGFASIRIDRSKMADVDLNAFEGIGLRVRGDGREFSLRLEQASSGRRSVSYRHTFATVADTWQEVWLPFDAFVPTWRGRVLDLPPVDPGKARQLGLMIADKIDGPFRLEVASIYAYGAFSLADLREAKRPLLVFAPSATDERLQAQLRAITADREAFDERDMELVVILHDGPSRVGSRPLSVDANRQLRASFNLQDRDFAIKLIGKDGTVKRSSDSPVPMHSVFAQIDEMPMRRAERRRGDM